MIARFILCFGWWGILSVLVWGAAMYACVASLRCERRQRRFYAAMILAVVGYCLAMAQGAWQHTIVLDRADEIRAAEENERKLRMLEEDAKLKEGGIKRFAEDAPGEAVSSAIMTVDELKGRLSTNAAAAGTSDAQPAAGSEASVPAGNEEAGKTRSDWTSVNLETEGTNMTPAYLAGGKVKRITTNTGTRKEDKLADTAAKVKGARAPARMLKLADYQLSNIESRVNRMLARLVLLCVFGIAIVDYLRRFNHPTDSYQPLPLAATWLTYFSYGEPFVYWPGANEAQLRLLRDDIVRRGQTFLYVGDRLTDGLPAFHRFRIKHCLPPVWPLRVLVWGRDGVPANAEFALDAVWFNRYAMCVPAAAADKLLPPLLDMLAMRSKVYATAHRLPHIIWDSQQPMAAADLERLARLCERTGLRLVMVDRQPNEQLPDEIFTMPEGEEPRPGLVHHQDPLIALVTRLWSRLTASRT